MKIPFQKIDALPLTINPKQFWSCPIYFGPVQIITDPSRMSWRLDQTKTTFKSWISHFEPFPVHYRRVQNKMIWTCPKWFGPLEAQGMDQQKYRLPMLKKSFWTLQTGCFLNDMYNNRSLWQGVLIKWRKKCKLLMKMKNSNGHWN